MSRASSKKQRTSPSPPSAGGNVETWEPSQGSAVRKQLRILVVEDNEDDCLLMIRELRRSGYDCVYERVETRDAMESALAMSLWDIVISDYVLPKFSGPAALSLLKAKAMDLPFIIVSGNIGEDVAVGAMKAGAHDYIIKGNLARLAPAVDRELRETEVRRKRRFAEAALHESQASLAKAQAIAHIGSWSLDLQSRKLTWSDELFRIFGIQRQDLLDAVPLIKRIVHPADLQKITSAYHLLLKTSKAQHLEYRIILPDGTERVVWGEADTVTDAAGKAVSIIGTVQDVTERKHAEDQLIRLATAVESAADALVVTDPAKGIIQYVNPAFQRITGYSREEVIGRDLHFLDSGRHDQTFYQDLRRTLKREGFWAGRLLQKKKDGTQYEEECSYSAVKNASGEIINYISIKRDVTEKIRLETIAQAVETMNNIGYIFSSVSHEIGNPVNSMRMTLNSMKKNGIINAEQMLDCVDRLTTQLSRMEYLLAGLKSFNMYESLQIRSVEVRPFLDSFLTIVKKDFESKGIVIEDRVERAVRFVQADPRALQQVLLNIFTNAADALEGRNNPKIGITVSRGTGIVKLRIKDNGSGIDEARLKNLFKPFNTTKRQGTGLGLVIVKKMLAKMNGTIEIASRVQAGACVEICIPEPQTENA